MWSEASDGDLECIKSILFTDRRAITPLINTDVSTVENEDGCKSTKKVSPVTRGTQPRLTSLRSSPQW